MADAQRSAGEQIQDAQPGFVTQAFVDLNETHAGMRIYRKRYMSRAGRPGGVAAGCCLRIYLFMR